jgi:hypothetical protein
VAKPQMPLLAPVLRSIRSLRQAKSHQFSFLVSRGESSLSTVLLTAQIKIAHQSFGIRQLPTRGSVKSCRKGGAEDAGGSAADREGHVNTRSTRGGWAYTLSFHCGRETCGLRLRGITEIRCRSLANVSCLSEKVS